MGKPVLQKTIQSLVGEVMMHKATRIPCRIVSETDPTKNQIADDIIYGVEFPNHQKMDCHHGDLIFFDTIEDRIQAGTLFRI